MNKLIRLVNEKKRVKLQGIFEKDFITYEEMKTVKTNRVITIEKQGDKYKFNMNGEIQVIAEDELREIFQNLVTVKINKVSTY